ncbi:putative PEP-binding protein [Calothrix sp. UHCC 0171]|uniref:putative PEP-binding protein n=1 Tax=Calothrix sp. UHCC 0171 TaxID=3110245 RepID=UPI002B1F544A|nr:putative PEP-binding protein [Calothrix sp. UHCC 0171]MEA5572867.1 putative PEP-binding protein [Calothrix sp. UHCC 0171]
MDKLYWLNQVQPQDCAKVGNKAFNLSKTMQRGYPVLPGFVVSAEFTREFLRTLSSSEHTTEVLVADLPDSSLHLDVGNWRQLQQVSSRLRQEISAATVPTEWVETIFEAASQWETSCLIFRPTVIVPASSSKNVANSENVNLSGLLESQICNCDRHNITLALKRTWSQLFRARSLLYWQRSGIDLRKINFAVLVQPVWDAVASGIIIGSSSFIEIQATKGLGLAMTQGEVIPDYYKIKRENNAIIEEKLGNKIVGYRLDNTTCVVPKITPSSLCLSEYNCLITYLIDEIEQQQFALPQDFLQEIINLSNRLTREFGTNFSCEWTISKQNTNETLYLTQVSLPQTLASDYRLLTQGLSAAGGRAMATAYVAKDYQNIPTQLPNNTIVVAPNITVDWLSLLCNASGIITEQGGMTSHAAILARELGIPSIVNVNRATELIENGEQLLVDGDTGEIYRVNFSTSDAPTHSHLNPREDKLLSFSSPSFPPFITTTSGQENRHHIREVYSEKLHKNSDEIRKFGDSIRTPELKNSPDINSRLREEWSNQIIATQLLVNLSQTNSIEQVQDLPVDGLGLLRSEMMAISILDGQELHVWLQEKKQILCDRWYEHILLFAQAFAPRPIFYRSLDLQILFPNGEGQATQPSRLGERGTFAYLQNSTMFELELAALAQVQKAGYSNIRLILPFVRSIEEFIFCRRQVEQAGLNQVPEFQLWIMAEVPSVLFLLPEYVKAGVQGIAIGTNDLTQLLLGVGREQGIFTQVWNQKNPAVMAAIRQLIETARENKIPCSICGQAPTLYPEIIEELVQWGITSISVEPEAVQRTYNAIARAEKRIILEAARRKVKE